MKRYIVRFFIYGSLADVYVDAENEVDAIKSASYGMEGYPEYISDVVTGDGHWLI